MTYLILFRGDDTDFAGNQNIDITLSAEIDLSDKKAHFKFLDFTQDWETIPEDKILHLVIPNAQTSKFPLGAMDAKLWLEDSQGRIRMVDNRIHIVVTDRVEEAYSNDDPQAITVSVSGGAISWKTLTDKPDTFPSTWEQVSDKPTEFTPTAHTHTVSQITDYANPDWTSTDSTSSAYIKNKPTLATVATSGKYTDLTGTPTVKWIEAIYRSTSNTYSLTISAEIINALANGEYLYARSYIENNSDTDLLIPEDITVLVRMHKRPPVGEWGTDSIEIHSFRGGVERLPTSKWTQVIIKAFDPNTILIETFAL